MFKNQKKKEREEKKDHLIAKVHVTKTYKIGDLVVEKNENGIVIQRVTYEITAIPKYINISKEEAILLAETLMQAY